jgi:hypothetical protein
MRLYSGYRYKNCECIPLEAKVALWLLQRIFLIEDHALEPGRSHTLPTACVWPLGWSLGDSNRAPHKKITPTPDDMLSCQPWLVTYGYMEYG